MGTLRDCAAGSRWPGFGFLHRRLPFALVLLSGIALTLTPAARAARLRGGSGDDTIDADTGDDVLLGGSGDDILRADRGNDTLVGGPGALDVCRGDEGTDTTVGCETATGVP